MTNEDLLDVFGAVCRRECVGVCKLDDRWMRVRNKTVAWSVSYEELRSGLLNLE